MEEEEEEEEGFFLGQGMGEGAVNIHCNK